MNEKYIYEILTANDLILFTTAFSILGTLVVILLFKHGVLQWVTKEIKERTKEEAKEECRALKISDPMKYYFAEKIYKTISTDIQTGSITVTKLDIVLKRSERLSTKEPEAIRGLLCELADSLRGAPDSSEKKIVINFDSLETMNSRFILCMMEFVKNVIEKNGLTLIIRTKKDSIKSVSSLVQNIKKYQSEKKKNPDDWNVYFKEED